MFKEHLPLIVSALILLSNIPLQAGSSECNPWLSFYRIESADYILLAKCVGVSDEKFEIRYKAKPDMIFSVPEYGMYRVIKSWKYDYPDKYYKLDFRAVNSPHENDEYISASLIGTYFPILPRESKLAYLLFKDVNAQQTYPWGITTIDESELAETEYLVDEYAALVYCETPEKVKALIELAHDSNKLLARSSQIALWILGARIISLSTADSVSARNNLGLDLEAAQKIFLNPDASYVGAITPLFYDTTRASYSASLEALRNVPFSLIEDTLKSHYDFVSSGVKIQIIQSMYRNKCLSCDDYYFQAALDENAALRAEGIRALATLANEQAANIIYNALSDDSIQVRVAALRAGLHYYQAELIIQAMALASDTSDLVSKEAITTLGSIYLYQEITREDSVIIEDALLRLAFKGKIPARTSAMEYLTHLKSEKFKKKLPELLSDRAPEIRLSAGFCIGLYCDKELLPYLKEALTSETDSFIINRLNSQIRILEEY